MELLTYSEYINEKSENITKFYELVKFLYKPVWNCVINENIQNKMINRYFCYIENELIKHGKVNLFNVTLKLNFKIVLVVCSYHKGLKFIENKPINTDENYYRPEKYQLTKICYCSDNILHQIYTATEAALLWKLNESTVRKAISNGKFIKDIEYRKAGSVIMISRAAMERIYGPKVRFS